MSTLAFYQERAAQCRREADDSTLDNVRARCLSAAAAWDNMAARMEKMQSFRTADAERKAAAVANV